VSRLVQGVVDCSRGTVIDWLSSDAAEVGGELSRATRYRASAEIEAEPLRGDDRPSGRQRIEKQEPDWRESDRRDDVEKWRRRTSSWPIEPPVPNESSASEQDPEQRHRSKCYRRAERPQDSGAPYRLLRRGSQRLGDIEPTRCGRSSRAAAATVVLLATAEPLFFDRK
jgi:hypothetical protein